MAVRVQVVLLGALGVLGADPCLQVVVPEVGPWKEVPEVLEELQQHSRSNHCVYCCQRAYLRTLPVVRVARVARVARAVLVASWMEVEEPIEVEGDHLIDDVRRSSAASRDCT